MSEKPLQIDMFGAPDSAKKPKAEEDGRGPFPAS